MLLKLFWHSSGNQTSSQCYGETGNQGVSGSPHLRPMGLPRNPMECAICVLAVVAARPWHTWHSGPLAWLSAWYSTAAPAPYRVPPAPGYTPAQAGACAATRPGHPAPAPAPRAPRGRRPDTGATGTRGPCWRPATSTAPASGYRVAAAPSVPGSGPLRSRSSAADRAAGQSRRAGRSGSGAQSSRSPVLKAYTPVMLPRDLPILTAHLERCASLRAFSQSLQPCGEVPRLLHQILPLAVLRGPLHGRLAVPHRQAEGALHTLLALQLPGWRVVVAPDMIAGEVLHVLPIEAQELDGLVLPPGIGMQLLIGQGARLPELLAIAHGPGEVRRVVAAGETRRVPGESTGFERLTRHRQRQAFSGQRRIGE